jgi:uncharacterized protein YvpB
MRGKIGAVLLASILLGGADWNTAEAAGLPTDVVLDPPRPAFPLAPESPAPRRYHATRVDVSEEGYVLIRTPGICQHPELRDGCEVTALAMLLNALGVKTDKHRIDAEILKDPTPIRYDEQGRVTFWGHPNRGFVGKVDGKPKGYGVFHAPVAELVNRYLPGQADDLTGQPFQKLLDKVEKGKPVVVWTTIPLRPVDQWSSWNTSTGPVRITWWEHAVLLVGSGPGVLYINDPADGAAAKQIDRARFEASWAQLGRQAVSVR